MNFVTDFWLVNLLLFVVGLTVLVKGSDWFVDAAAALARRFGVSELVIGLTLVSIGTSLPELASSLCAAWSGESTFIVGNIVGSNIANVALILGAGLVLGGAMGFSRSVLRRDMPVLLLAGAVMTVWFLGGWGVTEKFGISRAGGIVLLLLGAGYTALLCRNAQELTGNDETSPTVMSVRKASLLLISSLAMITVGAKCMVDTVVWSASQLGVDPLVISLTVVAVGTSLPELAVTISGVLKKQDDIALGNIIGSGIYNILLIVGCCSAITPTATNTQESIAALAFMNFIAVLLFVFLLSGKKLRRYQGWIFLACYAGFLLWSVLNCR